MPSRREFLMRSSAAASLGSLLGAAGYALTPARSVLLEPGAAALPPGVPGRDYTPVVVPDGAALPFTIAGDTKVFHLVAEPVAHEFAPGLVAECWGYNGRVHGSVLEAVEGDRVRIYVSNHLEAPTTVHWHGLVVPNGMDGVGGLTQRPIEPGETFRYEFVLRQHGTYMFHSHHDEMVQMALGLGGMFVIHPRVASAPPAQRDYVYLLGTWKIEAGTRRPDPNEMKDFNVLSFNGRVFPATAPLFARSGERVRIRLGNLSAMDHHPIHIHGTHFLVTETDGGVIPEQGRWPETSVLVPTGSTRTVELEASEPGDWAMHCHMTHHTMNQMGHGLPILVGVDPSVVDEQLLRAVPEYQTMGAMDAEEAQSEVDTSVPHNSIAMLGGAGPHGFITMGGMVTFLQVRSDEPGPQASAWYRQPAATQARPATRAELDSDGIDA